MIDDMLSNTILYYLILKYFIMKIPDKLELDQTASHRLSGIDFKDFINLYKKCTAKPYYFLVTDATDATDANPLRFRKNLVEIT